MTAIPPAEIDVNARVQQDMVRLLRSQSLVIWQTVLVGNLGILALLVIQFHTTIPAPSLSAWAAVVAGTTLVRSYRHWLGGRARASDRSFLTGVRASALVQGLAWGVGAALLMRWMTVDDIGLTIAAYAGILAVAMSTLAADAKCYPLLLLGVGGPLPVGLLVKSQDASHIVLALLVLLFIALTLRFHRAAYVGAGERLRATVLLRLSEQAQTRTVEELKTALAAVRRLSGLLPICANCKKVRDDRGYWSSVELYVSEHSDATFSHGICPACLARLYPDDSYPEPEPAHE